MKFRNLFLVAATIALACGYSVIQAQQQTDTENSQLNNPLPNNCSLDITVPEWLVVNDSDDNADEKWDMDVEPILGEKDTVQITITATADKSDATVNVSISAGSDKIEGFWEGSLKIDGNSQGSEQDGKEKKSGKKTSFTVPKGKTGVQTLYIEGIKHSDAKKDVKIKATLDAPAGTTPAPESKPFLACHKEKEVETTVYQVNLDVDSMNNNQFDFAGFDKAEDEIEASEKAPKKAGKYVFVNAGFSANDEDARPGWADGIDVGGSGSPADFQFVPLQLEIKDPFEPAKAKVKIEYSASDPAGVTRTAGGGTPTERFNYSLGGSGNFRIWKKDFTSTRIETGANIGGDFVPANIEMKWIDVASSGKVAKLYLEAVLPSSAIGDMDIKVTITQDGVTSKDQLYITCVGLGKEKLEITKGANASYYLLGDELTSAGDAHAVEYAVTAEFLPSGVDVTKSPMDKIRVAFAQNISKDKTKYVFGNPSFHIATALPGPAANQFWVRTSGPANPVNNQILAASVGVGDSWKIPVEFSATFEPGAMPTVYERALDVLVGGSPTNPFYVNDTTTFPTLTSLPKTKDAGGADYASFDTPGTGAERPKITFKSTTTGGDVTLPFTADLRDFSTTPATMITSGATKDFPVQGEYRTKKIALEFDFYVWCTPFNHDTRRFYPLAERQWNVNIDTDITAPQPATVGSVSAGYSIVPVRDPVALDEINAKFPVFINGLTPALGANPIQVNN